jgi:hypothetical protein
MEEKKAEEIAVRRKQNWRRGIEFKNECGDLSLPCQRAVSGNDAERVMPHVAERLSAGTAGAGVSVETGWRVKVTESVAERAAPAVVQPRFVRPSLAM